MENKVGEKGEKKEVEGMVEEKNKVEVFEEERAQWALIGRR